MQQQSGFTFREKDCERSVCTAGSCTENIKSYGMLTLYSRLPG